MKKGLITMLGIVLAAGLLAHADMAFGSEEKSALFEGVLVDARCYALDTRNTGNDHESKAGKMVNCGTACAATGIPVGLLEGGKAGGKVYILLVPSKMLAEHVGKTAKVIGRIALGGSLLVDTLEVREKDGSYKKVEIVTMM